MIYGKQVLGHFVYSVTDDGEQACNKNQSRVNLFAATQKTASAEFADDTAAQPFTELFYVVNYTLVERGEYFCQNRTSLIPN